MLLLSLLTYLHHFSEFGQVSSDEVQEGELVEVLGSLVAHLHHLVMTLEKSRLAETLPAATFIQSFCSLQRHLQEWRNG